MSIQDNRIKSVEQFIELFDASLDPDMWLKLCEEESKETIEALANLLKETADLAYVLTGLYIACGKDAAKMDTKLADLKQIDTIIALIQDVLESMPAQLFEQAFDEVHESNMTKVGDDGKPIRREDGKIMKGPNYKAPNMLALVEDYFGVTE